MIYPLMLLLGQGEPTPSLPHGKNPEIGILSIFRFLTPNLVSKVSYGTQFLINKHKIGVGFSLHSLQWGQ
jgi:hypothetical protein